MAVALHETTVTLSQHTQSVWWLQGGLFHNNTFKFCIQLHHSFDLLFIHPVIGRLVCPRYVHSLFESAIDK